MGRRTQSCHYPLGQTFFFVKSNGVPVQAGPNNIIPIIYINNFICSDTMRKKKSTFLETGTAFLGQAEGSFMRYIYAKFGKEDFPSGLVDIPGILRRWGISLGKWVHMT